MVSTQLDCTHSASAEAFVQTLRISAMWHLHFLRAWVAALAAPTIAAFPQGDLAAFHEAKRVKRPGISPPMTEDERTNPPIPSKTPLRGGSWAGLHPTATTEAGTLPAPAVHGGGGGTSVPGDHTEVGEEDLPGETEGTSLMQHVPLEGQWQELLEEVRMILEGYGKGERNQVAAHLLRLLHHRAADQANGRVLGQMGGKTLMLVSLLVAMRDDTEGLYGVKVPAGDEKLVWLRRTWTRITQFIPAHPGSHEAAGRRPGHELPEVEVPTRMVPCLSPPSSPIAVEDSLEMQAERPSKRRVLHVELSSGSADCPNVARMEVPMDELTGGAVRMQFWLGWQENGTSRRSRSGPTDDGLGPPQRQTPQPASSCGLELPSAAPHGLGTFGLSETDFERLGIDWFDGVLSVADVTREHGPHVAEHLVREWGEPGRGRTPTPPREEPEDAPAERPGGNGHRRPAGDDPEAEGDTTGLMGLWWALLPPVGATTQPTGGPERVDFFSMARRVLQYLYRTGMGTTVLSSALMEAIWRRGDPDYLAEAENFFVELDLPVDVDRCRSDDLTLEAHALVRWMEAGLWEEFIDHLEGLVGESRQVGDAREQPTMSPEGGSGRNVLRPHN